MVALLLISLSSFSHPRDSVRAAEKERARIERRIIRTAEKEKSKLEKAEARNLRERERIIRKWDERTMSQRRKDRQVLFFLGVGAILLVNTVVHHE